jgi:hypothetical protein
MIRRFETLGADGDHQDGLRLGFNPDSGADDILNIYAQPSLCQFRDIIPDGDFYSRRLDPKQDVSLTHTLTAAPGLVRRTCVNWGRQSQL